MDDITIEVTVCFLFSVQGIGINIKSSEVIEAVRTYLTLQKPDIITTRGVNDKFGVTIKMKEFTFNEVIKRG